MNRETVYMEVMSTGMLEPTLIEGDMHHMLQALNLAASEGKQFVLLEDVNGLRVGLETRNITRIREIDPDKAFI